VPRTLLLADDSVTIQRVIELTFADEDIRVVAVSDGDQAIAVLDKNPPDIVLADVGMPGRDGYQVAEHIKHTPSLAHIPVLLLTGAFEPIDQARAAHVGCDGVLAKPFEPQLVIGRVKELLSKPKAIPAAPAPQWTAVLDDPAPARGPASPLGPPEDVDQYFDRLDRAFATLSSGQASEPAPAPAQPPPVAEIDWFSTPARAQGSASLAPPAEIVERWDELLAPAAAHEDLPVATPPPPVLPPAPVTALPPPPVAALPPQPPPPLPLADAFAALLAAEQSMPPPPASPWPAVAEPAEPAPAPELKVTDEMIEDIVRRVLERLSDRVVRETVADMASETAERLVKEEIERIKNAAK
jgi:CheY-like chemotaxis protein